MQRLDLTAYLAPEAHVERVVAELDGVTEVYGRLVLASGPPRRCHWAENVWLEVYRAEFSSIRDAADRLRAVQRNFWPYAFGLHRRTELLHAALPHVAARPLVFPEPAPSAPLGSFVLLGEHELLCAPRCSSPFPNGEARFVEIGEDEGPPSRAYLKLFEALTLLGARPEPGQRCLELGASPGGWTWVLGGLGAEVVAVDRAPLAPRVAALANVTSIRGSGFALTPDNAGRVDWLFSDMACYPEKLLAYLRRWLDAGFRGGLVCTLKFQGEDHYDIIDDFAALPGVRLVHLSHNRHELTLLRKPQAPVITSVAG